MAGTSSGSGDTDGALIIAARFPYPGAVKTRLASRLGFGPAAELYRAFLRDLGASFPGAFWAYTPADSPFPAFLGEGRRYLVQEGDDLGERMFNLFRRFCEQGFEKVVLVGSDIPQLTRALVDRAFAVLAACDVVLGPAADGGYYLIGMRHAHDLFSSVDWSTSEVLAQTLTKTAGQGLSVGLLPQTFDVDGPEDLERLMSLVRVRGYGVSEGAANKRIAGLPSSADAVPDSLATDLLAKEDEQGSARARLPHTGAVLSRIRRADATLERSKVGWYYRQTLARVEEEEQACRKLVRLGELSHRVRRHLALVAGVAGVLVERLREDVGIPLSDVAVVAARYHDAYRSGDRSHRLRPHGTEYRGLFFPHDGHEARLAFALRQIGAKTVARIVWRHNVLRPLCPEVRTIDDNVLLIADAMVERGEVVPIPTRREAILARHAAADPQSVRAFRAAYDIVERTLDLYCDAGLNRSRLQRELGLLSFKQQAKALTRYAANGNICTRIVAPESIMRGVPMATASQRQYCTVSQAAKILHISTTTIWRWIQTGKLPAYRVGDKSIRVDKQDLEALIRPVVAPAKSRYQPKPVSEEELSRRQKLVAKIIEASDRRSIAPFTATDLVRRAKREAKRRSSKYAKGN